METKFARTIVNSMAAGMRVSWGFGGYLNGNIVATEGSATVVQVEVR
jgi:hypothetical protein